MSEGDTPDQKSASAASAPLKQAARPVADGRKDTNSQALRFEDAFARLEALVGEMERGELPLEQMLDRFEEGVRLVRHCNEFLSQAQLRVERYVEQKDGHWVLKEEKN